MLMKYEEIYKKIRDECGVISCKVEKMQYPHMPHDEWLDVDEIKKSINILRNHLHKFNIKIIEDGCSV